MAVNTPGKDLKIETIRGLALFLMVAGHVIGYTATQGMEVADDSTLRYLYNSLVDVRMPLFTAISGFVYALRPVGPDSALGRFYQGKLRRIVLPMVVVSTLFFLSQALIPGTNNAPTWSEMPLIYFFGYAHFWFLQAIFCIFLLVAVLDKTRCLSSPPKLLAVFALGVLASLNNDLFPGYFSMNSAAHLLPFFLLGAGLCRFPETFISTRNVTAIAVLLAATVMIDQAGLWDIVSFEENEDAVIGTVLGLSAIYMLIARRFFFAPLAWLGYYSYEIYLFHVFGTAGTRIALNKLSIDNAWIMFIASMVVGMLAPVVLKKLVERYNLLNLALFGSYAKRKPAKGHGKDLKGRPGLSTSQ